MAAVASAAGPRSSGKVVFRPPRRTTPEVKPPIKPQLSRPAHASKPQLTTFIAGSSPVLDVEPLKNVSYSHDALLAVAKHAVANNQLEVLDAVLKDSSFDASMDDNTLLLHCAECKSVAAFNKVLAIPSVKTVLYRTDGSTIHALLKLPDAQFFRIVNTIRDSDRITAEVKKESFPMLGDAYDFAVDLLHCRFPSRFAIALAWISMDLLVHVVKDLLLKDSFVDVCRGLRKAGQETFTRTNLDIALFFSVFPLPDETLASQREYVGELLSKGANPEYMDGLALAACIRCLGTEGTDRCMDISILQLLLSNVTSEDCDYSNMIFAAHVAPAIRQKYIVRLVNKLLGLE